MKTLIVVLLTSYVTGNAPFCVADEYGNLKCFYWSLSSCQEAARSDDGICTYNPNR